MKQILPGLLLLIPLTTFAQKEYTPLKEEAEYILFSKERIPVYYKLPDTLKNKPMRLLEDGQGVIVLGQYSPRWAVIKYSGFKYYIAQTALFGSSGLTVLQAEAIERTPPPIDPDTHLISYQKVVEAPGISKIELYSRALEWIAKTYNSAKNVIQVQDKETGKIILKALTSVRYKDDLSGVVHYNLSIYAKDGRYKYVFTDFKFESNSTNLGPISLEGLEELSITNKKPWIAIRRQATSSANLLAHELVDAMSARSHKDPSDF